MSKTIVISKETTSRLLMDIKQLIKNPLDDHGIFYCHDDKDLLKGYALIIGPKNTPYFGGFFFFELNFPPTYPYAPPVVNFKTNNGYIRFNPNLYTCGKVCLSILNTWDGEPWTACQNISTVLLTLCSILNESPLVNEPGVSSTSGDCQPYNKSVEYETINFAICDMITYKPFSKIFEMFNDVIISSLKKNYDELIGIVETNLKKYSCENNSNNSNNSKPSDVIVRYYTRQYDMFICANYTKLLDKIKNVKSSYL